MLLFMALRTYTRVCAENKAPNNRDTLKIFKPQVLTLLKSLIVSTTFDFLT